MVLPATFLAVLMPNMSLLVDWPSPLKIIFTVSRRRARMAMAKVFA